MKGVYKVPRIPELRKLYDEAQRLTAQIEHIEIRHALREHNQDADRLANEAMDRGRSTSRPEVEPHVRTEFSRKSNSGDHSGGVTPRAPSGATASRAPAPIRSLKVWFATA